MLKVLNLYAGLGGNRRDWTSVKVTAVELDVEIAATYRERFPEDRVIVADAHEYLLRHYEEFDFIWSSPPCPSHSRIRYGLGVRGGGFKAIYPDMALYQEILFLKYHFKGKFTVENVIPYYEPLIKPTAIRGRHCFWANFHIPSKMNVVGEPVRSVWQDKGRFGFNIADEKFSKRKDQILRNLVDPAMGLFVFNCAYRVRQEVLKP